jgi:hypothetical protein
VIVKMRAPSIIGSVKPLNDGISPGFHPSQAAVGARMIRQPVSVIGLLVRTLSRFIAHNIRT